MKKLLSVALALLMTASLFAGCGSSASSTAASSTAASSTAASSKAASSTAASTTGKTVTVNFYSTVGAYKDKIDARVKEFNDGVGKEKGIQINLTEEIDNSAEVFQTAMKSGNQFDMWSADDSNMLADESNGWLMDLNTLPQLADLVKEYSAYGVEGTMKHNGKIYSLALEVLPIKIVYNKDLFKAAGIVDSKGEVVAPKTWDDVIEDAKKITAAGNGKYYGVGYSFQWSAGVRRLVFKPWIASIGQSWFDNANGKYDFDAFKPAMQYLKTLWDDGSLYPDSETIQIDPIRSQFSDGKVGMEFAPAYDIAVYNDQFPASCDWDVAEVPVADTTKSYKGVEIVRGGYNIWSGVSEDKKDAVCEVFKWMSADDFMKDLYKNCKIIPANASLTKGVTCVEKTGWVNMSANLDNYVPMPLFPDGSLTLDGDNYQTVVLNYCHGGISLDDAVAQLDKTYNNALDEAVKDGKIDLTLYKISADYFKK